MNKKLFIFKELDTNNRDCVCYIVRPKFECGHYFGCINLTGACFSKSLEFPKNIKTILTKKEMMRLINIDKAIKVLGYGIKKDSLKYKKGLKILQDIESIFKKLESKENQKLFEEVIEEEKEYLREEMRLDNNEIDEIFDNYYLDYRDRGIVGSIYADSEELGMEEAETYIENFAQVSRYFDYEVFAGDLLEGETYIELSSGRCVSLNY